MASRPAGQRETVSPAVKVRVIKARRSGLLACGCWVSQGRQIVNRGRGWVCITHGQMPGQGTLF